MPVEAENATPEKRWRSRRRVLIVEEAIVGWRMEVEGRLGLVFISVRMVG